MNREVQRNTPGGWLRGLALALAHAGKRQEIDAAPIRPYRAKRPPSNGRERKAAAEERRARRQAKRAEQYRRQQEGANPRYKPDMAGSGQYGICAHCGKPPTPEGHDGCLGTLPEQVVMNACCGHGNDRQAYVQHWDGTASRGGDALEEQRRLIHGTMAVPARLLRGR